MYPCILYIVYPYLLLYIEFVNIEFVNNIKKN